MSFVTRRACLVLSLLFSTLFSHAFAATVTLALGQAATLSVSAEGSAPFSYQWYKNGAAISGAISSTYQITNAQTVDIGSYTVLVSNAGGASMSDSGTISLGAELDALMKPVIVTQPVSKTVKQYSSVTFSVVATSSVAMSYQWKKDGVAISGATHASYTLSSAPISKSGNYSVVVKNVFGSTTSNTAKLVVTDAPKITKQPIGQTVTVGSTVSLVAAVSASPAPTYQWKRNGVAISGATSATLTLTDVSTAKIGSYTMTATNSFGSATTQAAALDVIGLSRAIGADFNGDGNSDLLWHDGASDAVTIWVMNGLSRVSTITVGTATTGYEVEGTGDFNNDGKTDIVLRNPTTGANQVWLMNGTAIGSKVALPLRNLDFELSGIGDFNGDGYSDIMWRRVANSEPNLWLMNGTTLTETVALPVPSDAYWRVQGVGDFNGDGDADLIWVNKSTLAVRVQLMSGVTPGTVISLGTISSGWSVSGVGDFNDDGRSDILWRHSTGETRVWITNGTSVASSLAVATVPTTQYLRN